jgi:hypothetical protein
VVEAVVEKCGNLGDPCALPADALAAFSACAGDYEDPDRTAWTDDPLDEPFGDDDQGDALSAEGKTTIERNSNAEKAIAEIARRRNKNEGTNENEKP